MERQVNRRQGYCHHRQSGAVSLLMVLLISVLIFSYVLLQIRGGGEQTLAQVQFEQSELLLGLLDSALERTAYRYKSTSCDALPESSIALADGTFSVDSATLANGVCTAKLSANIGDTKRSIEVSFSSTAGVSAWTAGQRGDITSRANAIWQLNAVTFSQDLNAIYCFDANSCWIAGDNDTLLFGSASAWATLNPSSGESYRAITCSASDNCFVAGSDGSNEFIRQWNGSNWSSIAYVSARINDIACPSTICYAVGDAGAVMRYDGAWSSETSALSSDLNALACIDDSECWAVTSNDKKNFVYAHRVGTSTWQTLSVAENSAKILRSIACSGASCWAAGDNGAMTVYASGAWSYYGTIDVHAIYDIACRGSDNHCIAVGNNGSVSYYDGSSWTKETSASNHAINAAALFSESAATVVTFGLWRETY